MGFFKQAGSPMNAMMASIGSKLRKTATADGVPEGLFAKIQQDHASKTGEKPFMDAFVGGMAGQQGSMEDVVTVTKPEMSESIKKKKKGSYSTLLTGKGGSLGSPDIERKSILGG
jgi:formylmethanofuran dehydrogenase subunit B